MRKYQKIFMAGASLFLVCIMAIAGVLAVGNISQSVSVTIHYNPHIACSVWASTRSDDPSNPYYQDIVDADDFNKANAIQLYDKVGGTGEIVANMNAFIASANSFKFDGENGLVFYFLIENKQTTAEIQYKITISYGERSETVPYLGSLTSEKIVFDENSSTDISNVNGVPVEAQTNGLCKLTFKIISPLETAVSFDDEIINIDIAFTKGG